MDPIQIAQARHHTYLLFSKLFLHGLTAELLPYVHQIPQLAEASPSTFDSDLAAADHQQLFSFDIYPYESIFRDPQGLLGGRITVEIEELYRHSAYSCSADSGHIGEELAFLAFLCAAESSHLENGRLNESIRYTKEQAGFFNTHLLHWLPALETALRQSHQPFFAALGNVSLHLVAEHAASLNLEPFSLPPDPASAPTADFVHDPQTNLKTIAHFLLTPPYCGFYLGRESIAAFARSAKLPRGFGGREQLLLNLLSTAAQYDMLLELLSNLTTFTTSWQQAYQRQIEVHPHLKLWIEPWKKRTAETITTLILMRENAQNLFDTEPK